ncbi:MAG: hypothetical protein LBU87_06015 [Lactobacillales bacterium]|jgi:S-adenosylmethionine:diacylglycerol 3-amino-3-carboxypropyl transferase|nr:hypothetical protein [Lactobacillales bacterium]
MTVETIAQTRSIEDLLACYRSFINVVVQGSAGYNVGEFMRSFIYRLEYKESGAIPIYYAKSKYNYQRKDVEESLKEKLIPAIHGALCLDKDLKTLDQMEKTPVDFILSKEQMEKTGQAIASVLQAHRAKRALDNSRKCGGR